MQGLSILIVEEEYLVAAAMEATLLADGAERVDIARSVDHLDPAAPGIDLAIVEAKLGAPAVIAFTRALQDAGVATVVLRNRSSHTCTLFGYIGAGWVHPRFRGSRRGGTVHRLCSPGEAF